MFHFIFGVFLVGLVIMWMIASPAFRNFVFIALAVTGNLVWWLIDSSNKTSERSRIEREAQERVAFSAIKQADIRLDGITLKKASYGISDFTLDGTVTNNSPHSLGTIYFQVTITDCQNADCRIVGQATVTASVTVPANQVRAFASTILKFENLPPLNGNRTWNYKVTNLRAL